MKSEIPHPKFPPMELDVFGGDSFVNVKHLLDILDSQGTILANITAKSGLDHIPTENVRGQRDCVILFRKALQDAKARRPGNSRVAYPTEPERSRE